MRGLGQGNERGGSGQTLLRGLSQAGPSQYSTAMRGWVRGMRGRGQGRLSQYSTALRGLGQGRQPQYTTAMGLISTP